MNLTALFVTQPGLPDEPVRIEQPEAAQARLAQDRRIREAVYQEQRRLRDFIRRRMPDTDAAEDILQDVFYELTEAYRLTKPIGQVAAWLFGVARNKINDWYRKPKAVSLDRPFLDDESENGEPVLTEWLAVADDTADNELFRETILEALAEALEELPPEQREVFVRHELEGEPFKQIAADLNVSVNTLLSRKHYAVLYLRKRLQVLYNEWLNG